MPNSRARGKWNWQHTFISNYRELYSAAGAGKLGIFCLPLGAALQAQMLVQVTAEPHVESGTHCSYPGSIGWGMMCSLILGAPFRAGAVQLVWCRRWLHRAVFGANVLQHFLCFL